MNYLKQNHLSILIIVFLVVSSLFGGSVSKPLGALDRTTVGNPWTFSGAVTMSSTLSAVTGAFSGLLTTNAGTLRSYTTATTTGTAVTLQLSDINGYDTISVKPIVGATTLTFFASSTASTWLPTAGDMQETCILNATTTAAITLTFAGNTGFDMQVASSTGTLAKDLVIAPDSTACFKFIRKAATASAFDIEANMVEYGDND